MSKQSPQTINCPKCGSYRTTAVGTYYTKEEEIIRNRKCNICACRFSTYQEKEMVLHDSFTIRYPARGGEEWAKKEVSLLRGKA